LTETDEFVVLGVITGAHGIKGGVKLRSFTSDPLAIFSYDLRSSDGTAFTLKHTGEAKGQLICSVKDIRYRDEAEKLKGTKLGVARSALPAPEEDEAYIEDLIGMAVALEDGTPYGTVKAIHNFGAGDILEVATADGDQMFSFDAQTVTQINEAARTLTLRPPEVL
jgi:16S rRNA processing protein RimM